jgi:hypothetical protein
MQQSHVNDALALCCDEFDMEIDAAFLSLACEDKNLDLSDNIFISHLNLAKFGLLPHGYETFFDVPPSPAYYPDSVTDFSDDMDLASTPKDLETKPELPIKSDLESFCDPKV